MRKIHWALLVHLFYFSFAYSAWNDLPTTLRLEDQGNNNWSYVNYTNISNVNEFNLFAKTIKDSIREGLTANVILTNDIDLGYFFDGKECRLKSDSSIASFEPILPFKGIFNGDNHTITGLCIQTNISNTVGLFSSQIKKVSNLKIDNAYVHGDIAGTIIGEGSDSTEIINSHVSNSTVIGSSNVGGLVGKQIYSIKNSSVYKTTLQLESEINVSGNIGGLIGYIEASHEHPTDINECSVKDLSLKSTLPKQNVGGLIGSISTERSDIPFNEMTISNSFVETNFSIQNKTNLGGLIGLYSVPSNIIIKSSYFIGNILSSLKKDSESCLGGLVGSATNSSIQESFQKGLIKTEAGHSVGGFIGKIDSSFVSITHSYQKGPFQAKSSNQGLFIGSAENARTNTIESSYSAPDSGSSTLSAIGDTIKHFSFTGFIADQNGADFFGTNTKVIPSLLQQASAAYLLNKLLPGASIESPWTQNPDSNDGFPFIRPDYYFPIYRVILIDTASVSDTVYNSPLTGKISEDVFKKYPPLGGVGQDRYSFDNLRQMSSLKPKTVINSDITFSLFKSNHYAIEYNLNTNDFVFWLTDSISDYSENSTKLDLPIIIKSNSCFEGWIPSKDNMPTLITDPKNDIDLAVFNSEGASTIYLTAVWSEYSDKCKGWKTYSNNNFFVSAFHGLVTISNNGKPLFLTDLFYTIPSVLDNSNIPVPVPIHIEATPKTDYKLESLYYNSTTISGNDLEVSSQGELNVIFKNISGKPDQPYTITYDIPFEPLNDTTPTLLINEDYDFTYSNDESEIKIPTLVKAHKKFTGWTIQCSTKGTCSQYGILTDTLIGNTFYDIHYYSSLLSSFEGNIKMSPIFSSYNVGEKEPPIIQVNIKQSENGHLTLWNNKRKILSDTGTIKFPLATILTMQIPDTLSPPLYLKAIPDSSYEFKEMYIETSNDIITTKDTTAPFELMDTTSISAFFNKLLIPSISQSFKQNEGAFLYEGSIDQIETESIVSVSLFLQNKNGTYNDSLLFDSLKAKDSFSMKRINLPLGEFDFTVLLKVANTVIPYKYNFVVDSILQFKPDTWHMISLSNLSTEFKKTSNEVFFAWNDTASLGDFWQYQELHSMSQIKPSQGYWFQSFNDNPLPLQINTSSLVKTDTKISWNLVSGQTGWNLIANPYHWPISLNVSKDDSTVFWQWNDSLGAYDRIYHLNSNEAAWIHVTKDMQWETTAEPFFNTEKAVAEKDRIHQANVLQPKNWKVQLKLKNALGKEDAYNFIGVSAKTSSMEEPPQGMGSFVNLSILNKKEKLAESIISSDSSVWSWDILLTSSGEKEALLQLEGINTLIAMGYKVALNNDGSIIELKDESYIPVEIKNEGSKATITITPANNFNQAKEINHLTYHKQDNVWSIKFDAGIAFKNSKAVVSLYNIKGKKISSSVTNVHIGSNELNLACADYAGLTIVKIAIYNEEGSILYQQNQKLINLETLNSIN